MHALDFKWALYTYQRSYTIVQMKYLLLLSSVTLLKNSVFTCIQYILGVNLGSLLIPVLYILLKQKV